MFLEANHRENPSPTLLLLCKHKAPTSLESEILPRLRRRAFSGKYSHIQNRHESAASGD